MEELCGIQINLSEEVETYFNSFPWGGGKQILLVLTQLGKLFEIGCFDETIIHDKKFLPEWLSCKTKTCFMEVNDWFRTTRAQRALSQS